MDLFGRRLDGHNITSTWDEAWHLLESHTANMVVTKKDEWCDGLLIKDYDGCKRVQRQDLYAAYNVTPWAAQVYAVWQKAEQGV